MLLETFSRILFWIFVITNIVFGLLFVWKTFTVYRTAESKTRVIIKSIASLLFWIVANIVIIVVSTGYFAGHALESAQSQTVQMESATVYLISFITGWILVGAAILFWISRPPRNKNYGSN